MFFSTMLERWSFQGQEECCFEVSSWQWGRRVNCPPWLPSLHVGRRARHRRPSLMMNNTTLGFLSLDFAVVVTSASTFCTFILKKNLEELRFLVASRSIFFAINVVRQLVHHRDHLWSCDFISVTSYCAKTSLSWFMGVQVEDTSSWISVPSNSMMSYTSFLHRVATCLIQSAATDTVSCRLLSSVINVFVMETDIVVHEVAR